MKEKEVGELLQQDLTKSNRKYRRSFAKKTKTKLVKGVQDSSKATHQVYYIPLKRKSRSGVEYVYYKKVVDIKGLDKK